MSDIENINQQEEDESLDIRDLLNRCIANWKWFVVSVVVCVGIGCVYVLKTPKQYERSAEILIKDDSGSKGISAGLASMASTFGMNIGGGGGSNVNNEIAAIQAPSNIMETGMKLGLNMNYSVRNGLRHDVLYGKSLPVNVRFLSLNDNETASMKLTLNANGTYTMEKFRRAGLTKERKVKDNSTVTTGRIGQITNSPIGKVLVTATPYFGSYVTEDSKPISVWNSTPYDMTMGIQKNLTVELDNKQATVINITYKDLLTDRSEDVINTLISSYKEASIKDKNATAEATTKFINKRLIEIEQTLGGLDANISSYKTANLIPDPKATAEAYLDQAKDNTKELLALNTQRAMAVYIRSMLIKDVHSHQLLPANSGIDNQGIESQISDYNSMLLQRNSLVENSSTKNPLVQDLDQQLSAMRGAIVKSLNNLVSGIDTQVGQAQSTENQTKNLISAVPSQEKYLRSIGRKQGLTEQMYLFLLQKREESQIQEAYNSNNVRVLSPPMGSMLPVAPKGKVIVLIAFLLGLAIPVGVIFVQVSTNNKVRKREDFEDSPIPLIGEVSYIGKKQKALPWKKEKETPVQVLVSDGASNSINEAVRKLRTKFETAMPKTNFANVTLFTSTNAHSGKSFVAINLAKSFAIKGNKVLVIDGDLRKAAISRLVGNPLRGITDYLSGKETTVEKLIFKYEGSSNLSILPVGTLPNNPTELLDNGKLQQLLEAVRTEYDYIFIDSPALDTVADTEIIAPYADHTVLVLKAGQFEIAKIPELKKIKEENIYKDLTIILNGTEK